MLELIPIELNCDFENNDLIKHAIKDTLDHYKKTGFEKPWISYIAKDGKQPVGICAFKGKPKNNTVEIAYYTFPEYENQGFATEMCRKLVEIAKDTKTRISARTLPEINASTNVLKKNGFMNNGKTIDADDGEVFEWIL